MRGVRALAVLTVMLACAVTAAANPIDPVIIVRGGTGSIWLQNLNPFPINFAGTLGCQTGTWNVPQSDPTAFVNGQAFLSCLFRNMLPNQMPITSLTFSISPAGQLLSLFNQPWGNQQSSYFSQTSSAQNNALANFSVGAVPSGEEFEVVFIAFNPNTQFNLVANIPEPGTLALLGTGLLGIAARIRKKKRV